MYIFFLFRISFSALPPPPPPHKTHTPPSLPFLSMLKSILVSTNNPKCKHPALPQLAAAGCVCVCVCVFWGCLLEPILTTYFFKTPKNYWWNDCSSCFIFLVVLCVCFFFFYFVFFFPICFLVFTTGKRGKKFKKQNKKKPKKHKETQIKFKAEERKGHQKTNKQTNNNKKKQLSATDNLTQVTMKSGKHR